MDVDMDMIRHVYLSACRWSQEEVSRHCALPLQTISMPPGLHAEVPPRGKGNLRKVTKFSLSGSGNGGKDLLSQVITKQILLWWVVG